MSIESKLSGHWTDDQLIKHLYGVGPQDGHLAQCEQCTSRLAAFEANRQTIELNSAFDGEVTFDFLASQRRSIYHRLTEPEHLWPVRVKRWASASATVLALAAGLVVYQQNRRHQTENRVSDAQLFQEVSQMAQDSEPRPTAPLQALFVE